MAGGTLTRRRPLMMTYLTPPGRLEREPARGGRGRVAGDAGESAMARMGERVGGGDGSLRSLPRGIVQRRSASTTPRAAWLDDPETLLQRLGRIEWERRPQLAAALAHRLVAPGAVAGVHPRRMGHVAGLAPGRHLAVCRPYVE